MDGEENKGGAENQEVPKQNQQVDPNQQMSAEEMDRQEALLQQQNLSLAETKKRRKE